MTGMLEARGLCKRFGSTQALDQVSLEVAPGEIYCLLGANGAGKTTLVNVFLDFVRPDAGMALLQGRSVQADPLASKRLLAYIPEQVKLYGVLSGIENLRYFAALATGEEPTVAQALGLLAEAGLTDAQSHRRESTYSKGMRQKVGIAIARAKRAQVLLLDEPTSGLDPQAAAEFSALLRRTSAEGVAVLTTTHDLFHARQTGTRVGIMRSGRLLEERAAASLSHTELEALYLRLMSAPAADSMGTP
jgi:ABC-2 type transport system ATP-binding protein